MIWRVTPEGTARPVIVNVVAPDTLLPLATAMIALPAATIRLAGMVALN